MVRQSKRALGACLIGSLALAGAAGLMLAQTPAQDRSAHGAGIAGTKSSARGVAQQKSVPADVAKTVAIEPPVLAVIQNNSTAPAAPSKAFVNPHVSPGLVHWHASFAEACQAAQKSRKPVLLFHMMGKLDDLFC
ncbi:MAG TPA: hypothetical protein VG099_11360 [Gemmataceae bacterium]|jgi:hypothetical protein|nr:hypothetical protein [Gemmataceae bacterium]